MKKKYPSVSVCMIVRDEEKNLPRLFASIKGFADEVVVVDTGSEDDTVRVARSLGAKVHRFAWCDDFSAARNESLKHATKDFILWLDGDDELNREDHHKIRVHLRKYPGAGVYLRTYVEGQATAMQLRMFPNHKGIEFEGRIHEQAIRSLEAKGIPTSSCHASIIHHGYEEPGALREKLLRNRRLLEEEADRRPEDLPNLFFLARTCLGLGDAESSLAHLDEVIARCENDLSAPGRTVFNLALFEKGSVLAMVGRSEEALSMLSRGKSLFPDFALIRFVLGKLHFEKKEYGKAFDELLPLKDETFEKETTPINVPMMKQWLYRALGVSALFTDNLAIAESCFMAAIADEPSDATAYHHLAVARERKGDLDGAIEASLRGLNVAEDDAYMRKRLFFLLLKKEDLGGALECYETLNGSRMDPDVLSGRFLLSCKALEAEGIQLYYRQLQEKLLLAPVDFPQNLRATKEKLKEISEPRGTEMFEQAIKYLLSQAA